MKVSIKKTKEAYAILEKYDGIHPYLRILKYNTFTKKKILSDLDIDYIVENHTYTPEKINKVVKLAKWFIESQLEKWAVNFTPDRVLVTDILGETESQFHVYLKYKRNQEKPLMCFLPKKAILDDLRAEDFNNTQIDFTEIDETVGRYGRSLYEHQKSAVKFLITRNKCLLADDQGLGKTTSSIIASVVGNFKKVLIICPASLKSTWKRELKMFVPEDEIAIINGNDWIDGKKYTIINYDIVGRHYVVPTETVVTERVSRDKYGVAKLDSNGNEIIKRIEKQVKSRKKEVKERAKALSPIYLANFDLVIIDEVHKLSKNASIRYETISDFLSRANIKNIYLMSGTPMTNKPINLFHVMSLIDHEVCQNFEYFVKTYCDGKKIHNKQINKDIWLSSGASNLEELMEKIKNSYLRRLKKDIPGMVNKSIHQRYYDLTKEERLIYNNLWQEYENAQASLGNDNLNKELTEGIFLRQFVSNAMVKNTIQLTDEFLEDENKVFIACCFDEEIKQLKEYYGDKAVVYNGKLTQKQKDNAEYKFMNDPKTTVFIGNIIAAGVGLTLTSSHICIFNTYDWVPGNNEQMMDRIHRIGQKEDVEIYYQLFSDTISEDMWEKIIRKKMNIDSVIKEEHDK